MRAKSRETQPAASAPSGLASPLPGASAALVEDLRQSAAAPGSPDHVFNRFLQSQFDEVSTLARHSDILEILPIGLPLPRQYMAVFHCKGLVNLRRAEVEEATRWCVEISLPANYLRTADVYSVVALRAPTAIFHPNALFPLLCIGDVDPGTPVVDLLYRCYDLITFQKYRLVNHFNEEAAAYVRANPSRFPLDRRPLKRRSLELHADTVPVRG